METQHLVLRLGEGSSPLAVGLLDLKGTGGLDAATLQPAQAGNRAQRGDTADKEATKHGA
jgi:hypothetical protein